MKAGEVFPRLLQLGAIPKKQARSLAKMYSDRLRRKKVRNIDRNSPLGIYLRVERAIQKKVLRIEAGTKSIELRPAP